MIHIKTKIFKSAILLGTAVFFTMSPAWAGFEWTPPSAPEKVMEAPAVSSAPEAAPAPVVESRTIKGEDNAARAKIRSSKAEKPVNQISKMPPDMMEDPVVATVSPVSGVEIPAQNIATEYEDVQGFGADIPLVTAMSQIVPADFSYAVDDSAMLGQKVSWTGGMAWNKVLENAVEPLDLDVVVVDNTVWIREKTSEPAKAAQATTATRTDHGNIASAEPLQAMKPSSTMTPPLAIDTNTSAQSITTEDNAGSNLSGNMRSVEDEQASLSYPRRNPIPMMMKAGETEASDAPETMAVTASSVPEANPVAATTRQPRRNAALSNNAAGSGNYQHVVMPRSGEQPAFGRKANTGMDSFEIKYWTAQQGDSLRNVLTNWGQLSGTKIHWTSPYDYRLPSTLKTHATFPDAVTQILTFYEDLEPRPVGRLHPNLPNGPSVLVIENYGTMVN